MRWIFPRVESLSLAIIVMAACTIFPACRNQSVSPRAIPAPRTYVDEALCLNCHRETGKTYHSSAHALTSSLPSDDSIKGHFEPGLNRMSTSDPSLSFVMTRAGNEYFETAIIATPAKTVERRERIDIVVGSGRKGQTYLYWDQDRLFELPVSCWIQTREWMNSPGYPDGTANFSRGTSDRCLECHTTSFVAQSPPRNRFKPDSLVLGISCQKCHGPGSAHIAQTQRGAVSITGSGIVNPAKLSRERQMDLCSLCHAGVGQPKAVPLSYTAGDVLAKYLVVAKAAPRSRIDPHGSQVQTLTQSKCYRQSATLTCLTCHDVHQQNRSAQSYAKNCLTCHQIQACGKFPTLGEAIRGKCIDCHMPLEKTAKIIMRMGGQLHQPEVRTHHIGIYSTATPSDAQ